MSASLGLFRLQQIDSQIARIETRKAVIQKTLDDHQELQEARRRLGAAQEQQQTAERGQRQSEQATQEQQIKIQQAESSLYGGAVRNPKELQDLQADIISLKKHLAALEDRELQAMLTTEGAQAAAHEAQASLGKIQDRLGMEQRELFVEQEALTLEWNRFQSERQAAVSAIARGFLTIYEHLRQERRGVAVAQVSDNSCTACGTTLTAAIQQTARHAPDLVHCPSCGRILFAT